MTLAQAFKSHPILIGMFLTVGVGLATYAKCQQLADLLRPIVVEDSAYR